MSIVKAAFIEGRETEVEWDESKSKQAEVKLQVALDNISRMNEREYNTLIPLQQICPNTGKILNTFPSRLAAAKWVVANVLKRPDKNPLSITGNIEMCMRAGWKSYGYFWKICKLQDAIKTTGNTSGQQVFVRKIGKDAVFPSIAEAAAFVGVNRKTLSVKLKNDAFYVSKGYLCQFYNSQKKQLNFASVNRASIETLCYSDIRQSLSPIHLSVCLSDISYSPPSSAPYCLMLR